VIPLAYVYLGAGAVTVQATDIVMCRPMLRGDAGGDQSAPGRDVYGGGVEVATAGLALSLRNAGGRFAGSRVRWGISAADGTTAYTLAAQGMDGAALPVADDVIYFYACPPPYPAGYDSNLAPREHWPGATALTRYQGMAVADVHNAVIVASTVEPQVNTPLGSPTAGNFTMTCAPFAAAATIDRTTVAYLGAASWDFSGTDLLEQSMRGTTVIAGTATSTGNIVPGGAAAYNLWGVGGGAMLFPVSARLVSAAVDVSDNDSNDGDALTIRVDDETSVTWRWETWRAPFIGSFHYVLPATFNVSAAGNVTVTSVSGAAFDDIRIRSTGYEDCILGSR
jgi:hypothetical protein